MLELLWFLTLFVCFESLRPDLIFPPSIDYLIFSSPRVLTQLRCFCLLRQQTHMLCFMSLCPDAAPADYFFLPKIGLYDCFESLCPDAAPAGAVFPRPKRRLD